MIFKVEESNDNIVVASTRPELLFACQSIIVNPNDQRFKDFHGKHVQLPIFNRSIKIFPHHSVKQEFGSGAVMVCSYGDQNDVNIFRELGLKEIVDSERDWPYHYKRRSIRQSQSEECKKENHRRLDKLGLVQRERSIIHRTPLCERSKGEKPLLRYCRCRITI